MLNVSKTTRASALFVTDYARFACKFSNGVIVNINGYSAHVKADTALLKKLMKNIIIKPDNNLFH